MLRTSYQDRAGLPPGSAAVAASAAGVELECLVYDVAPGVVPNGKATVRIYLGTEEAQQRAERVFLYTLSKYRDPARVYHVYLLKDLPGFDRRAWRTGFTQYRFAIPELAGGQGRAIYNDVDQIYLTDPAALFDCDLQDCGYRAIAANDTSVMVMDCARMFPWWNLRAARTGDKRELVELPAAEPGLWGVLDGAWNARDFEYRPGRSKLLHYTTLHLQPWRPTPEQYSYHPHPLGGLWLHLEAEADARGYEPFTREHPSSEYRRLSAAGEAPVLPASPAEVVSVAHLEHLPAQDVAWFLRELFTLALRKVVLGVDVGDAIAPPDRPAPPRLASASTWWREKIAAAAAARPALGWELELRDASGAQRFEHLPATDGPRVWVLLGRHEGDNRQLLALAEALGWPFETRTLAFKPRALGPAWLQGASLAGLEAERSDALAPPWPDLVLACGQRSAPVARWIRSRSGGATRLVQLGRPRMALDAFDLIVTTPQYGLPGRANVLHNVLPLNRPLRGQDEQARAHWMPRIEGLPRPWIALLAGGSSTSAELTGALAHDLRARAEALARARGGSLLIVTSPRTPAAAADVLVAESDVPSARYRWRGPDAENPYALFLRVADELIVTGDSASMLAEACATGRPVHYVALPRSANRKRLSAWVLRALARRRNRIGERGTPRQQDRYGRWLDKLIASGAIRMPRDMHALHEALRWSGLAQPLGDAADRLPHVRSHDLERTVAAVRRMMLSGRRTA